jgi:glutamate racemase
VRIGFLHTSAVHTETFEQLVRQADATVETVTIVDESLLEDARVHGPQSDQVRAGINRAVDRFVESGVRTIVCTCSTISGQAELEGRERSIDVMRVDRPLAEAAVAAGCRISVLVALESTVGPTTALLAEVAATHNTGVDVTVRLCEGAWSRFEAGDLEGYLAIVAAECDAVAETSDVIVLAQASMAPASRRCTTQVPVISSPQLAVDAALSVGRLLSDGRG